HSRVATGIARLCILREDLYLELAGIAAEGISVTITNIARPPGLDDNGSAYRRLYFFRASMRTLAEVRETIHGLNTLREFREMLAAFDPQLELKVHAKLRKLNQHFDDLRKVRNKLGGHVSGSAVEKALGNINAIAA